MGARHVVLATGADYRRLDAAGADRFEGAGLYYAAVHAEALHTAGEEVVVVGGGNSAGQAAVHLTRYARRIHLVARRPLEQTMSQYLVDRIAGAPEVTVWTCAEIVTLDGDDRVEAITIRDEHGDRRVPATVVFALIGAAPRTNRWAGLVGLDEGGFILTGEAARGDRDGRPPSMLETTEPDVYAAGDARCGSTKRVASAVGDGALVVRCIHDSRARRT